jgi:GR25 family glycosyltransferase involved in LPS biosynthesis
MSTAPYTGIYINLDRSPERRGQIEEELRNCNLLDRYIRLPASDGTLLPSSGAPLKPGEIGCFHSHYRALLHAQHDRRLVHILEDDALLSEHVEGFAANATVAGLFDNFDIIFTETYVHANPFTLRFLKEGIDSAFTRQGELRADFGVRLFGLAMMELTCTSSYFVAPNSINRVLAVLKTELDAGPRMPLDLCLRAAADDGALKIACTMPFLTSVRLESIIGSTIASPHERAAGLDLALQSLLRYSFFVKRDLQGYAMPHLRQMVDPNAARDSHHQLMASVLSSILAGTNR